MSTDTSSSQMNRNGFNNCLVGFFNDVTCMCMYVCTCKCTHTYYIILLTY